VHYFDTQYFSDYSTNPKTAGMHDLKTIYRKVFTTLKREAKDCFKQGENHRFYPNPPKMSDLSVVSLVITAECLQITSENLLWSKLRKDYVRLFPDLIHRATFNRRRKALRGLILDCTELLAAKLVREEEEFIIDSIPIPTCKLIREKHSKTCRRAEWDEVLANKGYSPILGGYFIGYKMHLVTTTSGVYRDLLVTAGSEHDTVFLKLFNKEDYHLENRVLLGDRGYIGRQIQLRLFEELGLDLQVPYRRNQKDFKQYSKPLKIKRKTIEVVFSQYCDEYSIRSNYAKRFSGFEIRIISKIAAKTFKQFWNYLHGKPINQTKHALAA